MAREAIVSLTGGVLPSDPQFWLDAATEAVRRYCGWHIGPAKDEILTVDARGGNVLQLRTLKINSLTSVEIDGVDVTQNVRYSDDGMLELDSGKWPSKFKSVVVNLNHGFAIDEISDVAGVIVGLAKRAASATRNVVSEGAGSQRVQYGTLNGLPPGAQLMTTEKEILDAYRVVEY